jgi:alkylhydroperoxidase family enzyme
MKRALENSKKSTPRLPLPPVTPEEEARLAELAKARAAEGGAVPKGEGGRIGGGLGGGIVNNGRMRSYYLSEYNGGRGGEFGGRGGQGPGAGGPGRGEGGARVGESGFDNAFQTMLFWIVSRGNNCTYCMGHQESKLASAGLTDDQIAALDGDWSEFDEAKRSAFGFTKKLTYEPHLLTDADIDGLRKYYDEKQILSILTSVAGFNAMNRWTGPLRITQEERHVFLKPTSAKYAGLVSRVAPVPESASGVGFAPPKPRVRPALESRGEVESKLSAASQRRSRLALADESAARAAIGELLGEAKPANWMRLYATSPGSAAGRVASMVALEQKGSLDARTKAMIFWVAARNDRAWYALGHAKRRLAALGFTDDQMYALDDPGSLESERDRAVVLFAKVIAVDPATVSDADFEMIKKHFDDRKVAEIVHQISQAASFDRVTEAAGLPLEE